MAKLIAPSGVTYDGADVELFKMMNTYGMLVWTDDPFTLKSGIKSNVYFHGRNDVTDNPTLLEACGRMLGRKLSELFANETRQPILIGVPTAANGFAASVTHYNPRTFGPQRPGFRVMREKLKEHGANGQKGFWVNGRPDFERHVYATIENVVTSGASLLEAIDHLSEDGYLVKTMPHLVFMDRQQGGVKRIADKGYKVISLYKLLDVIWAFKEIGLEGWNADRVTAVEAEIKAHQVA